MRTIYFPRTILCALLLTSPASAQSPQPAWTEVQGYVSVLREHVPWASPENLVRDLRSSDDQTRLKALLLLGLSDNQAHIPDWSDTTPTCYRPTCGDARFG